VSGSAVFDGADVAANPAFMLDAVGAAARSRTATEVVA
jgi:hypothetical protein